MEIKLNPNISKNEEAEIRRAIKDNNGHCPCKLIRDRDTKCMCKEFREQKFGVCSCGLYVKEKPEKLVWYVFSKSRNANRNAELFNIFSHSSFYDSCVKAKRKYNNNFVEFSNEVKSNLLYYFWSKFEYETEVHAFPLEHEKEGTIGVKIDPYRQVMMNYEGFIKYVWENKNLLKAVKRNEN